MNMNMLPQWNNNSPGKIKVHTVKPVPLPLCLSHIPHKCTDFNIRFPIVKSKRLTPYNMA